MIAWVQPCAVPATHPLALVEGSQNACLMRAESPVTEGDGAPKGYEIMVRGPGAGGPETASSVIADIQFCAAQLAVAGLRRAGRPGDGPVPVYNYGANAFSRSQDFTGTPSVLADDGMVAPFFLRLTRRGARPSATTVAAGLRAAGLDVTRVTGTDDRDLSFTTGPASVRAVETALERVLQASGGDLSLDALYLPIIEGAGLAAASGSEPPTRARARTRR